MGPEGVLVVWTTLPSSQASRQTACQGVLVPVRPHPSAWTAMIDGDEAPRHGVNKNLLGFRARTWRPASRCCQTKWLRTDPAGRRIEAAGDDADRAQKP